MRSPDPDQKPISDIVRDDNLRLLFSEAAKRDLSERLRAIEIGLIVLVMAVLLALTAWVLRLVSIAPRSDLPLIELLLQFDGAWNFMISTGLLIAGIIAVTSPLILGMLAIERRRCRRELKDLLALLNRYGRN
jgi:hypothetical protein